MSETLLNFNRSLFYFVEYTRPVLLLGVYLYVGPLFLFRFAFFLRTKAEALLVRGLPLSGFLKAIATWVVLNFALKMFHTLYGIGFLATV
jgi:hypothetical protein